ncbi:MAG: hypothetical protein AB8B59_12395 [Maribacter sp.]
MGKKNLDKLFHEKLRDFSEVPDDKVWQSIETSLDKKKKSRRAIPIWWKLGGVAAVLLIAITLINPFEDAASGTPIVTDVNSDIEKPSEENNKNQTFENQSADEDQVVDVPKGTVPLKDESLSDDNLANTNSNSKEALKLNSVKKSLQKNQVRNQNIIGVQVANSDAKNIIKDLDQSETSTSEKNQTYNNLESKIAQTEIAQNKFEKDSTLENMPAKSSLLNEIENSTETGVAQNKTEDTTEEVLEISKKKSLFDEIEKQEQEKVIAENSGSKWSAGPSIAPVYFNAIGEGSPVHSIFVPNGKSGDVNLSYGLSIAYEVNKKLSIRSGVHKVDYGYRTNDVEFTSSLESASSEQIDNINYALTSKNLVVSSKAKIQTEAFNQNSSLDSSSSSDISAVSASRVGTMNQQFGYLEVPVELNYALLNKKFGINLIGGVSSLFLVDNSISLNSGELTTEMGEANNVNAVNFSTNVGFGINYKFTSKVQFNIEPVFKYQLNTFSETDGSFNPFSVGVYSGLNFKF